MIPLTLFTADYRVPGSVIQVNPAQIAALLPTWQRCILTEEDISKPLFERPKCEVVEVRILNTPSQIVTETMQEILDLMGGQP